MVRSGRGRGSAGQTNGKRNGNCFSFGSLCFSSVFAIRQAASGSNSNRTDLQAMEMKKSLLWLLSSGTGGGKEQSILGVGAKRELK